MMKLLKKGESDHEKRAVIVVLMAGHGRRFSESAKYTEPKWNISVPGVGRTLLDLSLAGLAKSLPGADFILVAQAADLSRRNVHAAAPWLTSRSTSVLPLPEVTSGPLATLSHAWSAASAYEDIFVQVCDTYLPMVNTCAPAFDADCVVYCLPFDRANLCHVDATEDRVVRLREKEGPCTNMASNGLFWIRNGKAFADAMRFILSRAVSRNDSEHFLSDAVNAMLDDGADVEARLAPDAIPLGTPAELESAVGLMVHHERTREQQAV